MAFKLYFKLFSFFTYLADCESFSKMKLYLRGNIIKLIYFQPVISNLSALNKTIIAYTLYTERCNELTII